MLLDALTREATPSAVTDRSVVEDRARNAPAPNPVRGLAVTVRDLHKTFDDNPVIAGLDLYLPAGGFTAIVGRSGCGKSTLLRLILDLETPTSGRIEVQAPQAPSPRAAPPQRIMFQEPRLLPWARVVDNVAVGLTGLGTRAERGSGRWRRWPKSASRTRPVSGRRPSPAVSASASPSPAPS